MKQAYEDLKEQLSKLSRALKILETKALKQTFSTNEIASKVRLCLTDEILLYICTRLLTLYKAFLQSDNECTYDPCT